MKTGIYIHTASRVEDLADALFEELAVPGDLFAAPVVVVPNRNIRRYLSLRRASGSGGVSAHVRFFHLEEALQFLLEPDNSSGEELKLVERRESILRVYAALEHLPQGSVFAGMTSSERPGAAVRRYHLADRLSRIFQEYEYHRAELVEEWWAGRTGNLHDLPESIRQVVEAEREIYLHAFSGIPRERFARYAFSALKKPLRKNIPRVRIFGFSQMSRFHLDLLARCSEHVKIDFYFLDLLAGFGQDRILAEWTRPFREAMDTLTAHGGRVLKVPAGSRERRRAPTVLSELERASAGLPPKKVKQDPSLQIVSCPTGRREMEAIHDSIMTNLAADPDLLLTDIAVLVPDMKRYRPWIESVFLSRADETGRPRIPFNLTDFSASQESQFVAGLESLLGLVGKEATRLELFELFRNPCFQAARRVSAEDVETWSRWVDELGAHRHFDSAHQQASGVEPDNLFTWDQALRRLRLGRVMETGISFQGLDPFQDMASGQGGLLSKFSLVLFELGDKIRSLAAPQPASSFASDLSGLIEGFLSVPEDRPEEESVRESLREGLDWLGREGALVGLELSADLALQFLLSMASEIPANRGRYLAGGVTIAALQPMRPVPFRIIYLAGMNEELFPGRKERSVLNLRSVLPLPGDFLLPDLNRMLFLETLRSARDKLIISYIGRDLVKDRGRAAASPVLELEELISRLIISGSPLEEIVLPLAGDSPWFLEARSPVDAISDLRNTWDPALRELALRRFRGESSPRHGVEAPTENQPTATPLPQTIRIQDLASFLENPVEGALARLGLREEEIEDPMEEVDEPFFLPFFARRRILIDTVSAYLGRTDRGSLSDSDTEAWIRSTVTAALDVMRRSSVAPRGGFGNAAAESLSREIGVSVGRFRTEGALWKTHWAVLSRPAVDAQTIPARITLGTRIIEFVSRPLFFFNGIESWGIVDFHLSTSFRMRRCALPFLVYVVLRCLPEEVFPGTDRPFQLISESPKSKRPPERVTIQLTRKEAHAYLTDLTDAFLEGAHEFLPWELWENRHHPGREDLNPQSYVDDLELLLLDRESNPMPLVRVKSAELAGQTIPANAWDLVMKRWQHIYAGQEKKAAKPKKTTGKKNGRLPEGSRR